MTTHVDSVKVLSMNAAIARGTAKADAGHLVTDAASSALWDRLEADHARLVAANPGRHVEIPNDPDL